MNTSAHANIQMTETKTDRLTDSQTLALRCRHTEKVHRERGTYTHTQVHRHREVHQRRHREVHRRRYRVVHRCRHKERYTNA